jgi:hypothetical protein
VKTFKTANQTHNLILQETHFVKKCIRWHQRELEALSPDQPVEDTEVHHAEEIRAEGDIK